MPTGIVISRQTDRPKCTWKGSDLRIPIRLLTVCAWGLMVGCTLPKEVRSAATFDVTVPKRPQNARWAKRYGDTIQLHTSTKFLQRVVETPLVWRSMTRGRSFPVTTEATRVVSTISKTPTIARVSINMVGFRIQIRLGTSTRCGMRRSNASHIPCCSPRGLRLEL